MKLLAQVTFPQPTIASSTEIPDSDWNENVHMLLREQILNLVKEYIDKHMVVQILPEVKEETPTEPKPVKRATRRRPDVHK